MYTQCHLTQFTTKPRAVCIRFMMRYRGDKFLDRIETYILCPPSERSEGRRQCTVLRIFGLSFCLMSVRSDVMS